MNDNPYNYNNIEKCAVCGRPVGVDDYGNSDVCKHCGWQNDKDNEEWDKTVGISYPMLVPLSRAREQYKKGLPFKATFNEFIKGLFFYSEMVFRYNGKLYEVFLYSKRNGNGDFEYDNNLKPKIYKITMERKDFTQTYYSKDDFHDKAEIDGKLLKDIWDEVEDPGFMWCGKYD